MTERAHVLQLIFCGAYLTQHLHEHHGEDVVLGPSLAEGRAHAHGVDSAVHVSGIT